ncbi:MAG TPA: alanine--tRNA ligase [Dehalococcoidia bacterium]
MNSNEIREAFLRFFEERGHRRVPSSPLVPWDDPTLLFTSAGMVQFKPYFMGQAEPPARRLTSVQKCFRTTDIDDVGDASHLTFFEMLGNFSVGDYFKREAIAWAWEFVTQVLRLPPDRLWTTVFYDDDEAYGEWRKLGVPEGRIMRYGEAEGNYWYSGETGPCGPCSEIHYDFGADRCPDPNCHPDHGCGRFLEIWNLVFMSFFRHEDGSKTPLPQQNIDTGAGLERLAWVLQNGRSVYDTDVFRPVLAAVEAVSGRSYGQDPQADVAMRVVAEHARAVTFLLADGVLPSNEGRGYVLRRVLRRAVYFGHTLGIRRPFLNDVVTAVLDKMAEPYPYLRDQEEMVRRLVGVEEERFRETLTRGLEILEEVIQTRGEARVIPGEDVFRLYDTYGVPRELTAEIAGRRGFTIDADGFERAMERQRERARAQAQFGLREGLSSVYTEIGVAQTPFLGYDRLTHEARVLAVIVGGERRAAASQGDEVELVLDQTPFYPEGGGQVGDAGTVAGPEGRVDVADTQRVTEGIIVHRGRVVQGTVRVDQRVTAQVDEVRRRNTMRNHTGTHLLHAALRQVLGTHVRQAGSLVAPDRLRFDYTHTQATTPEELREVQRLVNEKIRQDVHVRVRHSTFEQAMREGVLAFFGEKYADEVRVVEINGVRPFSAELCGGTHVHDTGEIGYFQIVSDSSIGSGVRRIEALTGPAAEEYVERQLALVGEVSRRLGVTPADLPGRVESLLAELEAERRRRAALERQAGRQTVEELAAAAEQVNGSAVVAARVAANSQEALREMGDWLRDRLKSAVIVLGTVINDRPAFVAVVTPDLTARGVHAGQLVKEVAAVTGGGGGGRPELAQAGGRDSGKLDEALNLARQLAKERITA